MGKIIAVDFDGTICESKWPDIGPANVTTIQQLISKRRNGDKLILWTCRSGAALRDAVEFCRRYGLEFDAVNDNLPEMAERYGSNSRKVWADEYWDDKSKTFDAPTCDNCRLRKNTTRRQPSIYSWCANTCRNYKPK